MKWEKPVLIDLAHSLKALGGALCFPLGSSADIAEDCHNGNYIFSGNCTGGGDASACGVGVLPNRSDWRCASGAIIQYSQYFLNNNV